MMFYMYNGRGSTPSQGLGSAPVGSDIGQTAKIFVFFATIFGTCMNDCLKTTCIWHILTMLVLKVAYNLPSFDICALQTNRKLVTLRFLFDCPRIPLKPERKWDLCRQLPFCNWKLYKYMSLLKHLVTLICAWLNERLSLIFDGGHWTEMMSQQEELMLQRKPLWNVRKESPHVFVLLI